MKEVIFMYIFPNIHISTFLISGDVRELSSMVMKGMVVCRFTLMVNFYANLGEHKVHFTMLIISILFILLLDYSLKSKFGLLMTLFLLESLVSLDLVASFKSLPRLSRSLTL